MLLQILATETDADRLLERLRDVAKADPGCSAGLEDSYCVGALSAYVAGLNRDANQDAEDPRPLSDAEIDELLVNVSISKLERLLHERRLELADTPDQVRETLEDRVTRDELAAEAEAENLASDPFAPCGDEYVDRHPDARVVDPLKNGGAS